MYPAQLPEMSDAEFERVSQRYKYTVEALAIAFEQFSSGESQIGDRASLESSQAKIGELCWNIFKETAASMVKPPQPQAGQDPFATYRPGGSPVSPLITALFGGIPASMMGVAQRPAESAPSDKPGPEGGPPAA